MYNSLLNFLYSLRRCAVSADRQAGAEWETDCLRSAARTAGGGIPTRLMRRRTQKNGAANCCPVSISGIWIWAPQGALASCQSFPPPRALYSVTVYWSWLYLSDTTLNCAFSRFCRAVRSSRYVPLLDLL